MKQSPALFLSMVHLFLGSATLLGFATFIGCVSGPHAHNGATLGALVGAPLGAVIGSQNGEPLAGALVGGTIGSLTGNSIGASVDQEQRMLQAAAQRAQRHLTMQDVISLSQNGVGEDVIINQIQSAGMIGRPSTNDLLALKNAGVSDRVIRAMQTSHFDQIPRQAPIVVEEHYWNAPTRVPFYDPYSYRPRRPCPPPIRRRRGTSISFSHRF